MTRWRCGRCDWIALGRPGEEIMYHSRHCAHRGVLSVGDHQPGCPYSDTDYIGCLWCAGYRAAEDPEPPR